MSRPFATPILAIASVTPPGQRPAIFAGAEDGLAVSRDGGHAWSPCLAGIPISALAVNPTVLDDGLVIAGTAHGVWRSSDWGETWREVSLPGLRSLIAAIAIAPDGLVIAGAMDDGLYRSTDGGQSWLSANAGAYIPRITALATTGAATWVAGTTHGAFISDTAGRSWDILPGIDDDTEVTALACAGDGQRIVLGTGSGGIYLIDPQGDAVALDPVAPDDDIVAIRVTATQAIQIVTSSGIEEGTIPGSESTPDRRTVHPLPVPPSCAAFHGDTVIVGAMDGTVSVIVPTYPGAG